MRNKTFSHFRHYVYKTLDDEALNFSYGYKNRHGLEDQNVAFL